MFSRYDQWKLRSPDDFTPEDDYDERADAESLNAAFDDALSRDEMAPGFHISGPFVVEVFANGDCDFISTVVLPSREEWEPTF